jgi:hypothetical protein
MFVFNINPNNFFKAIGLEKDMIFHKIKDFTLDRRGQKSQGLPSKTFEEKTVSLWINKKKAWDLYLYTSRDYGLGKSEKTNTFIENNQRGEIIKIEPGMLVKVVWFTSEIPYGKMKNTSIFGGPAQLKIYPKIPIINSKKENESFFKDNLKDPNLSKKLYYNKSLVAFSAEELNFDQAHS